MAAKRFSGAMFPQQDPSPASDCMHDRSKVLAARREVDQSRRDRRRSLFAPDNTGSLEVSKTVGQQIGRDAGQTVSEVGIATRSACQQLAHDEECPSVSDDV